jgi:hypothetical protein
MWHEVATGRGEKNYSKRIRFFLIALLRYCLINASLSAFAEWFPRCAKVLKLKLAQYGQHGQWLNRPVRRFIRRKRIRVGGSTGQWLGSASREVAKSAKGRDMFYQRIKRMERIGIS